MWLCTGSDYVPDEMWPARDEKDDVTAPPRVGITVTRARPMAAAMRPYSMAVAPDSSLKNFFMLKLQLLLTAPIHLHEPATCKLPREYEMTLRSNF